MNARLRRAFAVVALLVPAAALAFALWRVRERVAVPGRQPAHRAAAPGTPVFEPRPATALSLEAEPFDVSPDGFARWLVRVHFSAGGEPVRLARGGDILFAPTHGVAQWQTRLRFGGPAAVVATTIDGPLGIRVSGAPPLRLAAQRTTTDTRAWKLRRVVARALGPHLVQIGWFPPALVPVRIERTGPDGRLRPATVAAPSSTYRDTTVIPGETERYAIAIPGRGRFAFTVGVPPEAAHAALSDLAGKGMWLAFSPSASDPDGYDKLRPAALAARAATAGIAVIDLRVAYGPFSEITPAARAAVAALVDAAADRGVRIAAWTVPRSVDFDDIAGAVAATRYRTPRGHGFAALAVDLERGNDFLGSGPDGYAAIATYARRLRAALGPAYPVVATVEDPYLGHLTNADYPYAAVARAADALQPMTYWRMMAPRAVTADAVGSIVRASYAATLRAAGLPIAIEMGGQTTGEGPRGAPPPGEIAAAVRAAQAAGALGITFFDWNATSKRQWAVLARTRW